MDVIQISNVPRERLEETVVRLFRSNDLGNFVEGRREGLADFVALGVAEGRVVGLEEVPGFGTEGEGDGGEVERAHDGTVGVLGCGEEGRRRSPRGRTAVERLGGGVESGLERGEDTVVGICERRCDLSEEEREEFLRNTPGVAVEEMDELSTDFEGSAADVAGWVGAERLDVGDNLRTKELGGQALADGGEGEAGGSSDVPERISSERRMQWELYQSSVT